MLGLYLLNESTTLAIQYEYLLIFARIFILKYENIPVLSSLMSALWQLYSQWTECWKKRKEAREDDPRTINDRS